MKTQQFTKKLVAASVATALGAGASIAFANVFADTTQTSAVTTGVNVPKASSASVTNQFIDLSQNVVGAVAGGTGTIVFKLDNGAKWASAPTLTYLNSSASAVVTASSAGASVSGGTLTVNLATSDYTSTVASQTKTIRVSGIVLDTSGSTVETAVNASLDASSTATGITTGSTSKLATVKPVGVTPTATTSASSITANATFTLPDLKISEIIQSSLKDMSSATDEVTITLPTGVNFTLAGTAGWTGSLTANAAPAIASNVLKIDVTNTGASTSASDITLTGAKAFVPSGTANGDINATIAVKLSDGTTATSTMKVASVVSGGTTNKFVEGGSSGSDTYNTLFTGRTYAAGFATAGLEADKLSVAEIVPATLQAGGGVTFTLSNGAVLGAGTDVAVTVSQVAVGANSINTAKNAVTVPVTTASTTTAGYIQIGGFTNLDLTSATVGDLNVAISSTTGATAGTLKLAAIKDATSSSVSGGAVTGAQGTSVTLNDIVITESTYGALSTTGVMGVYIADANGATVDVTSASAKAYKADGTDISSTIFGSSSGATLTNSTNGLVTFPVAAASTSSTGPVTIKVKGLKPKINSSAAGTVKAVVGGAAAAGTTTLTSAAGVMPTKAEVTVANVATANVPVIDYTESGANTAKVVTGTIAAAGNDAGKAGTIYVAGVVNGVVYLKAKSGAWSPYDPKNPVAFDTGVQLGVNTVNVLDGTLDVSGLVGAEIYVGYGVGSTVFGAAVPFNNMLTAGTYKKVYTIK